MTTAVPPAPPAAPATETLRIGDLAARAGVSVDALRYYERRGLLRPTGRRASGYREYPPEAAALVRFIKRAQALGFTLAEIEEYLRVTSRNARAASDELRIRLAAKIDEVDAKIAALRRVRDGLAQVVGCACDSLDRCTCGAAYLARRGRVAAGVTTTLHVTNGESAANTLRATPLGGAVLGIISAVLTAWVSIMLRQIGRTESALTTVFWFSALSLLPLGAIYLFQAQAHGLRTWLMLAGVGLLGGAAQLAMTGSLARGPVSVVVPMDYTSLLWATLLGWLVFGTLPVPATWIGAPIIVASGLYIVWREHLRRREITEAAISPE